SSADAAIVHGRRRQSATGATRAAGTRGPRHRAYDDVNAADSDRVDNDAQIDDDVVADDYDDIADHHNDIADDLDAVDHDPDVPDVVDHDPDIADDLDAVNHHSHVPHDV